jgi:pyruvate dehydrogenase E1 component alpha subunit
MMSSTKRITSAVALPPAPTPSGGGFQIISSERLLELYSTMLKCRMFAEGTRALIDKEKLSATSRSVGGREATDVGVALGLLPADTLASSECDLSLALVRGVPLHTILERVTAHRQPSAAARLKAALTAARAHKAKNDNSVAVFFRSAAKPAEALWDEALRIAGAEKLPILFVSYPGAELGDAAAKTERCCFPAIAVDCNDAVAVYRVATEAVVHARRGNGPTLIECVLWPMRGAEPDDPILNMEAYLSRKGLFSTKFKADVSARFERELAAALRSYRLSTRSGV